MVLILCVTFLFCNVMANTEIYTLSLHDALPISNSSINFSVTDTNSSRTSEAALWPSTYISPLSNSTPCIRKDRISSKSLMRLSICLWKPRDRKSGSAGMPRPSSYAVFCLKKKNITILHTIQAVGEHSTAIVVFLVVDAVHEHVVIAAEPAAEGNIVG